MTKIPHHAVMFVGDGRKALFLRNAGDEKFPNLKMEAVFEDQIRRLMRRAVIVRGE